MANRLIPKGLRSLAQTSKLVQPAGLSMSKKKFREGFIPPLSNQAAGNVINNRKKVKQNEILCVTNNKNYLIDIST